MTDKMMSYLLRGFRHRPEFESFTSQLNEIGLESATQLCNLIDRKNEDPYDSKVEHMPYISEVILINNKSCS